MNKYLKLLNWIIGGIVTLFFLYGPMLSFQYDCFFIYTSSRILAGLFLMYCLFSVIYWIINKNFNLVIHYCLIVGIYTLFSISLFIIAISIG